MTYRGHVEDGRVVLDEPTQLPEGAEVKIEVVQDGDGKPTIWGKLLKLAGTVEGLPPDMAQEHDHYLYGTPKKR